MEVEQQGQIRQATVEFGGRVIDENLSAAVNGRSGVVANESLRSRGTPELPQPRLGVAGTVEGLAQAGRTEDQSQKNPNDCAIIDPWPPPLSSISSPLSVPGIERIVHVRDIPQRFEHDADWPDWIDEELKHACHAIGVDALWHHQLEAANTARSGSDIVIATPTASGKSLGFWLPVIESIQATRDKLRTASALYIAPTKALAADQLTKLERFIIRGMRPAAYDGDTSQASKDWARRHANIIFTNPDMLHRGILPQHERFARMFKNLRFIVIDEAHRYRGVFGPMSASSSAGCCASPPTTEHRPSSSGLRRRWPSRMRRSPSSPGGPRTP